MMAQAFIRIAIENPNRKIFVFDHHRPRDRRSLDNIIQEISKISKNLPPEFEERLAISSEGWVKFYE